MTTYQDPPPHSRRAVRQSERDESAAKSGQSAPVQPTPYIFDAPGAPATGAAVGDGSATDTSTPPQVQHTGRRVQLPSGPAADDHQPGFEPLNYSTQGRLSPPLDEQEAQQPFTAAPPPGASDPHGYRVRDFSPQGGRRAAPPREPLESPLSASSSFPAPPQARPVDLDYHTQGVPPSQAPTPSSTHSAGVPPRDDPMDHTLTRRELREMRAAAEQRVPPLQAPPMQMAESIDTLLNSGPIEIPTLAPPLGQSQALAEAMAEFDQLTRARRESEARARDAQVASLGSSGTLATPIVPQPQPQPQPQPWTQEAVASAPVAPAPVASAPVAPAPLPPAVVADPLAPAAFETEPDDDVAEDEISPAPRGLVFPPMETMASTPVASVPVASVPVASVPVPSVPVPSAPVVSVPVVSVPVFSVAVPIESVPIEPVPIEPVRAEAVQPAPASTPIAPSAPAPFPFAIQPSVQEPGQDEHGGRSPRATNHWRVQAAMEDDDQPYENTLSRTVGSNTSAITTSALVLPSVPQPDSMLASLNSTGEILITGSINLPRSLGSTGAHPHRVDHADDEDDPFDSQVSAPDSAPVRAIRAVSSNTSTRGVIETRRPQGNRLLTVVIVVAGVLCVGLVGLLVFAVATGKL
jgi:hypothetical protein